MNADENNLKVSVLEGKVTVLFEGKTIDEGNPVVAEAYLLTLDQIGRLESRQNMLKRMGSKHRIFGEESGTERTLTRYGKKILRDTFTNILPLMNPSNSVVGTLSYVVLEAKGPAPARTWEELNHVKKENPENSTGYNLSNIPDASKDTQTYQNL